MEKEFRYVNSTQPKIEIRNNEGGESTTLIVGEAIVFNTESKKLYGMFYEIIDPRALDEADMSDVVAKFNHSDFYVLGRTTSGTLRLIRTEKVLAYEADAPNTQTIKDLVLEPMKRGDIVGSSFAFTIAEGGEKWEYDSTRDAHVRTITKIEKLYDVSPVTDPAYATSSSGYAVRSLETFKEEQEKLKIPPVVERSPTWRLNLAKLQLQINKQ